MEEELRKGLAREWPLTVSLYQARSSAGKGRMGTAASAHVAGAGGEGEGERERVGTEDASEDTQEQHRAAATKEKGEGMRLHAIVTCGGRRTHAHTERHDG